MLSLNLSLSHRHQYIFVHKSPPPLPLRDSLDKRKTTLFQRCSAIIQGSQACLGVTKQFAFSVCCSWYRYGFEKSARGRERGKERVYRFTAPSASCYQPLFTLRIERCVVLWLLISSLLRVLHSRVKGRAHYRRTSCVLLLESRLRFGLFELRAAGGWKCRKMILSLAVWSWVRRAFMVTDFIFILSYLNSCRVIDTEGFRPRGEGEGRDGLISTHAVPLLLNAWIEIRRKHKPTLKNRGCKSSFVAAGCQRRSVLGVN